MKAKHTQGEWFFEKLEVNEEKYAIGFSRDRYKQSPIANVYASTRNMDKASSEALANAKLIAAAPDLLEALKSAMPHIRHSAMDITVKKAQKAIQKATGDEFI